MTTYPIVCRCQHCLGDIHFDPTCAGETVTCHHCAMNTLLHLPGQPGESTAPRLDENSEIQFLREGKIVVTNTRFAVGGQAFLFARHHLSELRK